MQINFKYCIFDEQVQQIVTHMRLFYNWTDAVVTITDAGNSKIFGKSMYYANNLQQRLLKAGKPMHAKMYKNVINFGLSSYILVCMVYLRMSLHMHHFKWRVSKQI